MSFHRFSPLRRPREDVFKNVHLTMSEHENVRLLDSWILRNGIFKNMFGRFSKHIPRNMTYPSESPSRYLLLDIYTLSLISSENKQPSAETISSPKRHFVLCEGLYGCIGAEDVWSGGQYNPVWNNFGGLWLGEMDDTHAAAWLVQILAHAPLLHLGLVTAVMDVSRSL